MFSVAATHLYYYFASKTFISIVSHINMIVIAEIRRSSDSDRRMAKREGLRKKPSKPKKEQLVSMHI